MKSRLAGIDAGRFVAAFCVVLIHTAHSISFTLLTHPSLGPYYGTFGIGPGDVITQLCRWAVPFFFLSGGYFAWRADEDWRATAIRMARRLLPVYLAWSIIYNLASPLSWQWFYRPGLVLRWLLNGGAGDHLWFLPALFIWVVVARALKTYVSWAVLLAAAGVLYVIGVGLAADQLLFLSTPHQQLFTLARDGPFFGLIFVATGMFLRQAGFTLSLRAALGLFSVGAGAQLGEAYLLNRAHILPFFKSDYLLATFPFGVGAFMLSLKLTRPAAVLESLAVLGRYALGIYAGHLFFVEYLAAATEPHDLAGRLAVAVAAMAGSTGIVVLLARIKYLKSYLC